MPTHEAILRASTSNAYTEIVVARRHFVYSFSPVKVTEQSGNKDKRQLLTDGKHLFWGCLSEYLKKENICPQRSTVERGMPVPC